MAAIEEYTLEEVMQKMEEALNQNPGPIKGLNAIYQYDITDEDETIYQMKINDGKASVTKGADAQADCTLKLSLQDFHKLLLGKLNGTMAFMSGKLKIKGDIGKAVKIEGILRKYNVKEYL